MILTTVYRLCACINTLCYGQSSLPQPSIIIEDAVCFNHETQSKVKCVPKTPERLQADTVQQLSANYLVNCWMYCAHEYHSLCTQNAIIMC